MARSAGRIAKSFHSALALLALSFAGSTLLPSHAAAVSSSVVISQVYASGGLPGAAWQNDYVVLFNNGTAPVSLAGWALQIRPEAGGIWPLVPLAGVIAHGHYYLVQLAQGGPFGAPLPPPDLIGTELYDPTWGALCLTSDQNAILGDCAVGPSVVDLVGYGPGMTCSETTPAPSTDAVSAISREPACTDTDNNAADFHLLPANPRNSSDTNGCNNQAPAIQPIADQTIMEGSVRSFFAVATDGDGDPIAYGATGPAWFTIAAVSGQCTLSPDLAAAETGGGVYAASVTASDGIVASSKGFTITVTDFTTAANIPYSSAWPGGVDMATGELALVDGTPIIEDVLFTCLGGPLPLCFGGYYASFLAREGLASGHLGTNWLGTYDQKLEVTPTTATIVDNRGEALLFTRAVTGDWIQSNHFEEHNTLVVRAFDNMHRLHRGHRRRTYEFDGATGLLQKILDEHGNSITCSYTGSLLTGVSDGHGRALTFAYDAGNRVISVSDGTRTVSYGYTGNDLTSFTDAAGHTTNYSYAAGPYTGLLASVITPLGTTPITYAYDADGRVSSFTDALANTWTFGVGPGGGCIMTTPTGGTWQATHDAGHRLLSLTDPLGATTSWTYDAAGRPASVARPLGDVTTLAYDAASGFPSDLGRADGTHVTFSYASMPIDGFDVFHVTGVLYPDGASQIFHYGTGNLDDVYGPSEQNYFFTYNANGQVLSRTNPAGGVTTFTYDPQLRLVSRTDNAGNTTTFAYDGLDRLVTLTHPDATGRGFTYDVLGRLLSETDEAGKVWAFAYDLNGRLISRTDPLGHSVQYAYDAMSRVTGVTDALGHTERFGFDPLDRLTYVITRTNSPVYFTYDLSGRLIERTDPAGSTTRFTYDANGRPVTITDPLAHVRTYEYDALDRVTRQTDPLGNATQYVYDAMGRLITLPPPVITPATHAYDSRGYLTMFSQGPSQVLLGRSPLGEVTSIRDPNTKVWPYTYDAQGRLTSRSDPLARSTSFTYDSRSRLSHMATPVGSFDPSYDAVGDQLVGQWIAASGSVTLNYTYDDARQLTGATGATFAYDAADRLVSSNGIAFTHDDEGRVTSETYAPGKTVTYSYDTRGLLSQVTDWLGGTTAFAYDAAGWLTGLTRPNGTTATYQYDAADRLIQKVEMQPGPPSTPLATIAITRDALGQITEATRDVPLKFTSTATESTGYAYDDASQVVGFGYDGLGRLVSDGSRTFEYDAAGRVTRYTAGAESPTFTYDAFGRMLTRTDGATTRQFVWASVPAYRLGPNDKGTYCSVFIDCADGKDHDVSWGYVSALDKIDQGGATISYFVHTPGGVPLYKVDASGARTYYHYDEAGNTIFLTEGGGLVLTGYAYSPTGKVQALGYTAENPYAYAGAAGAIQLGSSGLRFHSGSRAMYGDKLKTCISCPSTPLAAIYRGWIESSFEHRYFKYTNPGPISSPLDFVGTQPGPISSPLDFVYKNPGPINLAIHSPLSSTDLDSQQPLRFNVHDDGWPSDRAGCGAPDVAIQPGPISSPLDFVGTQPGPINSPLDFVGVQPGPIQIGPWRGLIRVLYFNVHDDSWTIGPTRLWVDDVKLDVP